MHSKLIRNLAIVMVACVAIASLMGAYGYSVDKGVSMRHTTILCLFLGAATIAEVIGWHTVVWAWMQRRAGLMFATFVISAAASFGVFYTNASTVSFNNNEKAITYNTAYIRQETSETERKAAMQVVNDLTSEIAMLVSTHVKGKPTDVAGAQAEVANIEAQRLWTVTEGCKNISGPKTKAFCAEHTAAVQLVGRIKDREAKAAKLEKAKLELAAFASQSTQRAVVSKTDPGVRLIKASLHTDDETAGYIDNLIVPTVGQLILIFGGAMIAIFGFTGERKPWFTGKISMGLARLWSMFTGAHTTQVIKQTMMYDPVGAAQAEKMAKA